MLERSEINAEDADNWGGDDALVEIPFLGDRICGPIPLSRITSIHNPYVVSPWDNGQNVTIEGVETALREGRLEPLSYSNNQPRSNWTTRKHEERIAWLVTNGWNEPIEIEFRYADMESFRIWDGNHRLAAAIYRQDTMISVQLGGFFDNSIKGLGVICRDLQTLSQPLKAAI